MTPLQVFLWAYVGVGAIFGAVVAALMVSAEKHHPGFTDSEMDRKVPQLQGPNRRVVMVLMMGVLWPGMVVILLAQRGRR